MGRVGCGYLLLLPPVFHLLLLVLRLWVHPVRFLIQFLPRSCRVLFQTLSRSRCRLRKKKVKVKDIVEESRFPAGIPKQLEEEKPSGELERPLPVDLLVCSSSPACVETATLDTFLGAFHEAFRKDFAQEVPQNSDVDDAPLVPSGRESTASPFARRAG